MISAILLMAGKGARMNKNINKVLLEINNIPIYRFSLDLMLKHNFEVICVISKDDEDIINDLPSGVVWTFGGENRARSVYNGLKCCTGDYVIIHDAARPFVSSRIYDEIIRLSKNNSSILCYLPVVDTIKKIDDGVETLQRDKLVRAVTPQCAPKELLISSYNKAIAEGFNATDDIALIERYYPNEKITLLRANDEAFKITNSLDYELAKIIGGGLND